MRQAHIRMEKRAVHKLESSPLYVRRNLKNSAEFIAWAKQEGFAKTVPADELHVTICFSKDSIDWSAPGDSFDDLTFRGGKRSVVPLGDKGAVVLKFEADELSVRWQEFLDAGASWDFPSYQPHVTITYQVDPDLDLAAIEPFAGPLEFGPEIFEPMNDDWSDGIVEKRYAKVAKLDDTFGLVIGWAIVCKIDGEDYYDLNIDREGPHKGKRIPEHIEEETMFKSFFDFASSGVMPGNEMHKGPTVGQFISLFPMTTEIAKSLEIETKKTGLIAIYKPTPEVYKKFRDGTYTGFSIEGWMTDAVEIEA